MPRSLAINRDYTQNPPIGYRSVSDTWSLANPVRKVEFELLQITAVRLKVEENQLVGVFGEIGVRVDGLKSA
jgi:hypothetical protein